MEENPRGYAGTPEKQYLRDSELDMFSNIPHLRVKSRPVLHNY